MSTVIDSPAPADTKPDWRRRTGRVKRSGTALVARGESMLWLTGGALAIAIYMIIGLIALIVVQGATTFWPLPVIRVQLLDGTARMGEVSRTEQHELTSEAVGRLPDAPRASAGQLLAGAESAKVRRRLLRTGNFDLTGTHFETVNDFDIAPDGESLPEWAVVVERMEWGRFYGEPVRFEEQKQRTIPGDEVQLLGVIQFLESHRERVGEDRQKQVDTALQALSTKLHDMRRKNFTRLLDSSPEKGAGNSRWALLESGEAIPVDQVPADANVTAMRLVREGADGAWEEYHAHHATIRENAARIRHIEKHQIGRINAEVESARLKVRAAEIDSGLPLLSDADEIRTLDGERASLEQQKTLNQRFVRQVERWLDGDAGMMAIGNELVQGLNQELEAQLAELTPKLAAARDKLSTAPVYAHAALEAFFDVTEKSRLQTEQILQEIETLRAENARYNLVLKTAGEQEQAIPLANIVRAYAPNQLTWGGKMSLYTARWWEYLSDEPREANSEGGIFPAIWGTIVMTLVMSLAVVPFGVLAALYLREYAKAGVMVSAVRIAVNNLAGVPSIVFGVFGLGFFCYVVGASLDELFFTANLPNPTFGKGGLLWASLTLALMTLPVVIVATEEALSAVPNSMREGSYACGASKWQTIRRIVLPRAMPGIMTGMILAMARGAGEVAPLMLVGAVKLAPELPVDGMFPFVHPERSFMHLGFHIFDLGFQSQNSEAAKPMVFTTTLLLITIIAVLNLFAIWLRGRLRRKFLSAKF